MKTGVALEAMSSQPLPIEAAAQVLGVPVGTLRRWVKQGAPCVQRGRRGRGHALLVDVQQVQQWRGASAANALALELATALPEVLAESMAQAVAKAEGVDRSRLAGIMAATWYLAACDVLDLLRTKCPSVPQVSKPLPAAIQRLEKIARN